jgi:hypothetical protein
MSSEFVRWAPGIETIDPHLDELLAQIIDFVERKGRESPRTEGTGRAVRGAHAKSFGLVKAEVELLADVPSAHAQGIYARPGRHGALIRFSSTSGHLGTDAQLGPGLGFAMKMFDVAGPKLVDDEPDSTTFDLVLKNSPVFICNTAKHYLFIEEITNDLPHYLAGGTPGFHKLLTDFLTGRGTLGQQDWAWEELLAFVRALTQIQVGNPLLVTYWSMGAVRHGDNVAKIRVVPPDERHSGDPSHTRSQQWTGRVPSGAGRRAAGAGVRFRPSGPAVHGPGCDAGRRPHRGVAREAVPLRHRRARASAPPGHLRPGKPGER